MNLDMKFISGGSILLQHRMETHWHVSSRAISSKHHSGSSLSRGSTHSRRSTHGSHTRWPLRSHAWRAEHSRRPHHRPGRRSKHVRRWHRTGWWDGDARVRGRIRQFSGSKCCSCGVDERLSLKLGKIRFKLMLQVNLCCQLASQPTKILWIDITYL